jgi:O-antigen/teichoic acid export membrane protein
MVTAALSIIGDAARVDLRNRRRTRTVAVLNVTAFLVTLILTIRLVVFDEMGVQGVVWGGAGGALFGMIAGYVATRGRFPLRFDRDELRRMLRYGLPIVPHRLVSVGLMMYSQYCVREMLGLDKTGLFDMAARFALPLGLVINAIQEAWVPYKFHIHANDERPQEFFRESFTYYLALILYLWVGAAAWGPEVLRLMTDARFHAAASLVALTGLMRIMWGVYMMMGSGIELSDDTRPFSLISVTGLLVVVGLTTYAVPAFGAAGAALSTTGGYLAMAVMARRLAQSRFAIYYDWPRIAALSASAIGCVVATYFSAELSLSARLAVAATMSLIFPVTAWLIVGGRREHSVTWQQAVEAEIGS